VSDEGNFQRIIGGLDPGNAEILIGTKLSDLFDLLRNARWLEAVAVDVGNEGGVLFLLGGYGIVKG